MSLTPWNFMLAAPLLAIVLLLVLFMRDHRGTEHRPRAALLAYVIAVAAGAGAIGILFYAVTMWIWAQVVLNLVLLGALLSAGGNVVDLFRRPDQPNNLITRILRGDPW
ncbi:phage holin family protein [Chitiniphilus eburneus]|uniref:phage holin family protein n=1 Tax=Chitiniphilus eburneus TaxID=2571148 RepID=UPI0035D0349E